MAEKTSRKRARIEAELIEDAGDWAIIENAEALVESALAELAVEAPLKTSASLSIALSNDASIAVLNGQYRGKPKPTNVLSFPAGPAGAGGGAANAPRYLGDLILAVETLQREAADEDIPVEHHFQHLVIHGTLHLLGYDHETDAEAEAMEALEIKILARLGITNPYTGALNPAKS